MVGTGRSKYDFMGNIVQNEDGSTKYPSLGTLNLRSRKGIADRTSLAGKTGFWESLLSGRGFDGEVDGQIYGNSIDGYYKSGLLRNTQVADRNVSDADLDAIQADTTRDKGTDWGMDGWGGIGLGIGQLGLGVLSYFDGKENNEQVLKGMKQTYRFNEDSANNSEAASKKVRDAIGRTAAKMATPGGLVSRASADYQKPTAGSL